MISQPPDGDDLRHPDRRGEQHPARRRCRRSTATGSTRRRREPRPDDEPVLDGGLVRQLRRPARRVRPVQAAGPLVPVLHDRLRRPRQRRRTARTPELPPCNKNFRTDARAAWLATSAPPKITEYDNIFYVSAGQDESGTWQEFGEMKWKHAGRGPGRVRPQGVRRPTQTNWAHHALRRLDLVGVGGDDLAERLGQHVDRGRELGHVDVRPRAVAQPVIPDNYGNPYGAVAAARLHRHVGHDEPRHVQRPRRPAHALPDPADAGLLARLAAQHPQQALPELRRRQPT